MAAEITQRDRILDHLLRGESLTPITALELFGCFALSQRIGELKRMGHDIETVPVTNGRKRYASYRLRGQLDLIGVATRCAADTTDITMMRAS